MTALNSVSSHEKNTNDWMYLKNRAMSYSFLYQFTVLQNTLHKGDLQIVLMLS